MQRAAAEIAGSPSPATARGGLRAHPVRGSSCRWSPDIHFDHRLAIAASRHGADTGAINPGKIGGTARLPGVARRAAERGCAIRVGVNAGSLEKERLLKHGGATPAASVESAERAVRDLEAVGFRAVVISLKPRASRTHRRLPSGLPGPCATRCTWGDRGRLRPLRRRQVGGGDRSAARRTGSGRQRCASRLTDSAPGRWKEVSGTFFAGFEPPCSTRDTRHRGVRLECWVLSGLRLSRSRGERSPGSGFPFFSPPLCPVRTSPLPSPLSPWFFPPPSVSPTQRQYHRTRVLAIYPSAAPYASLLHYLLSGKSVTPGSPRVDKQE